jgi:multiple sugar transport system permease protein
VAGRSNSFAGPRRSWLLTGVMGLMLVYAYLPLLWLVISSTKTQRSLISSFGLWFHGKFALWDNVRDTLSYQDHSFVRWFLNTLLYVVAGAGGATVLATLAGYGLAKFAVPGRRAVYSLVLGGIGGPATALAVPTFLMFSKLHLTNSPWGVIIPSMVSPFGMYLMWIFSRDAVPDSLLEVARIDGASEFQTFRIVSLRLLTPGIVTVALFTVVATWNNYFLPLIMLNDPDWYPLTVGLHQWNNQAVTISARPVFNLVVTGSLLTIIPITACFLSLQRYWRSGLAAGSVKQ